MVKILSCDECVVIAVQQSHHLTLITAENMTVMHDLITLWYIWQQCIC